MSSIIEAIVREVFSVGERFADEIIMTSMITRQAAREAIISP